MKDRLSHYVRLAAAGETALVTDRDEVVAVLGAPPPGQSPRVTDAVIAAGVRDGWLTPPMTHAPGPPPRLPVATTSEILAELDADRGR